MCVADVHGDGGERCHNHQLDHICTCRDECRTNVKLMNGMRRSGHVSQLSLWIALG